MENLDKLALWYQVSKAKFLGPVRFRKLWRELGDDLGKIFTMRDEELLRIKGAITKQNLKGIHEQKNKFAESLGFMKRQVDLAAECGGGILTFDDPKYPKMLQKSTMCHPLLYYIGSIEKFTYFDKSIAIVGTRAPAVESANLARRTAHDLASHGWVIVSGLAKGIDSKAHEGALDAQGKTIAVLGSGPEYVYPLESKELYARIKSKGLIVSEYPFGSKPEDWKLKKRNKTTVALSVATLVVETSPKGGTMNAVKACKEQKKKVFVFLPTWPCDKSGNEKVVQDGAIVLTADSNIAIALEENLQVL